MTDLKSLNCLLPKTRNLLQEMVKECGFLKNYVLVGGSALALHLCHRKSEDLDFFTYSDSFDIKEIFDFLNRFKDKEIINQNSEQIDVLLNGVKVTFFNAKWNFLKPDKIEQFNLASRKSIAAMKVNTLFLRAKYRDYYDLYCLIKNGGMGLMEIYENSVSIVEGINFKLFAAALLYIDDIEEDSIAHLEPKEQIPKEEIRNFFEEKLKRIINQ